MWQAPNGSALHPIPHSQTSIYPSWIGTSSLNHSKVALAIELISCPKIMLSFGAFLVLTWLYWFKHRPFQQNAYALSHMGHRWGQMAAANRSNFFRLKHSVPKEMLSWSKWISFQRLIQSDLLPVPIQSNQTGLLQPVYQCCSNFFNKIFFLIYYMFWICPFCHVVISLT